MNLCKDKLCTNANQFGFKEHHGTDMCVFALKSIIDYYNQCSSPVFICYLDASKAFDRLNYWTLFKILIDRDMPLCIVRLLVYWYSKQVFIVRWGNSSSHGFKVSNGVRQGGVLSPYLFNVYTDGLSMLLNQTGIGCSYNNMLVNNLMYADDTVLIAPSASGLQKLLLLCEKFAENYDILFNVTKTVCMCVKPPKSRILELPRIYLNSKLLDYVSSYTYLGVVMSDNKKDDMDINQHIKAVYARGNMLLKNFRYCSKSVKCQLF